MKIESPILNVSELATEELVENTIGGLTFGPDNFAVLSKSEMSFIQCLNTEKGFIVQFQEESIDKHYEFIAYLSKSKTIALFQAYLSKSQKWQGSLEYTRVNLRGFWGGLGYTLGRFMGRFYHGVNNARNKT